MKMQLKGNGCGLLDSDYVFDSKDWFICKVGWQDFEKRVIIHGIETICALFGNEVD